MKKKLWTLCLLLTPVAAAQAETGMSSPDGTHPATTINAADGTVTFNYRNDNAKEVLVDVQFAGRIPGGGF